MQLYTNQLMVVVVQPDLFRGMEVIAIQFKSTYRNSNLRIDKLQRGRSLSQVTTNWADHPSSIYEIITYLLPDNEELMSLLSPNEDVQLST